MTKILKLKKGTPGQESAKAKLDILRANGLISAENDALLQQIVNNGNTWLGEHGEDLSKKERESFLSDLYDQMYRIASGQGRDPYNIGNDPVSLIISDTMSGKLYIRNNSGTRNYITAPKKMTFASPSNTSTSNSNIYWALAPEPSITGDWAGLSTNNLKSTILNEGNKWLNYLQQVLNAKNQGLVVLNFKGNLNSLSQASLDSLSQYLNSLNTKETADYEDISNFAKIMSVLTPGESAYFTSVFQPFIDALPEADKNWRELKAKGYKEALDTHEYLTQNKYKVLQDSSGKKYIYDENYNLIENPVKYIDRSTNYGIFSDGKNTFIGNIDDENLLNEYNPLYKTIQEYKSGLYADKALDYKWDEWYDPELNDLYKALYNKGILKNGTRFTDVSDLFNGTELVIAINNDGSPIKKDLYGEPDLSNATLYYWDGFLLQETTKKKINLSYNREGYGEADENVKFRPFDVTADFDKYGEANRTVINADKDIQGDGIWSRLWRGGLAGAAAGAAPGAFLGPIGAAVGGGIGAVAGGLWNVFDNRFIKDDPQVFADEFIKAVKNVNNGRSTEHFEDDNNFQYNPSSELLLNNFGWNNPENAMAIAYFILNNKDVKLSHEDLVFLKKEWYKAKQKSKGNPTTQKQGGVLKGKQGLTVGAEERAPQKTKKDDNIGKAQDTDFREFNRSLTDEGWSTEDTLRLSSLVADLGGAVSAFVPGFGTIGSVGTGLVSTATDLAADIVDESTSLGELGANLVTNLGFTAAGAIPGVKLGKVAKSMIKWAPRIIAGLSTANIALNGDIHDSLAKLNDNSSEMTVQDWKNVLTAATALLGAVKVGKSEWDNRTVRKALGKGTFTKKDLTTEGLTEDLVKLLNKALKSGDLDKAIELLKKFGLNEDTFTNLLEGETKRTIKNPIKGKTIYKEIEYDKLYDEDALLKLWKNSGNKYNNIKKWIEINDPNYSGKSGGWYDYQMKIRSEALSIKAPKASKKALKGKQKKKFDNVVTPTTNALGGVLLPIWLNNKF